MIKKLTPETDAAWAAESGNGLNEVKEISRKLERERDEANSELNEKYIEYDQLFEEAEKIRIERDEARERCSKLEKAMSYSSGATTLLARFLKVLNERDALVQKLDAWEEIAEHLHHLVQHPAYGVDQAIRRMDVLEAYKHLKK